MVLYLLVAGLTAAVLLAFPVRPAELTPSFWVFTGAAAIGMLAGARSCGCRQIRPRLRSMPWWPACR